MFCRHSWKETERFFGRLEGIKTMKYVDQEVLEALVGQTTILYICEKCGAPKTKTIVGRKIE
jgi:hypothetical protein